MKKLLTYDWATHQPLIKALLELKKPQFVLELGIGMFSTPLFDGIAYLGIENDAKWIAEVLKNSNQSAGKKTFMHHDIGVPSSRKFANLNKEQREGIVNYFLEVKQNLPDIRPSMLFVDSFVATRGIGMKLLQSKFDVIVFHDAQPRSAHIYDYPELSGFSKFYLTSEKAWTGVYVRNLQKKEIQSTIRPYIDEFRTAFGYRGRMEVIDA